MEETVLEEIKIKARIKFFNLIKIHKFRHEIRQSCFISWERIYFLKHGVCSIAVVIFRVNKMVSIDG